MERINLGKVVGTTIRSGEHLPTDFSKWLEGDIFIHTANSNAFYKYDPNDPEKLVYLGDLQEKGQLKRVSIMPSDVEDELGDTAMTYPFWKSILTTLDIREDLYGNYGNVFFVEVEDPEQNDKVNYLIIQNEFDYVITNFKSFIDYDKISQTYKVYDLIDLYNRPSELYRHNIYLSSYAPSIVLEFSLTNNKNEPLTKDDIINYCAFTYGHTIPISSGTVLTVSMDGETCWALAAMIFDVDTDTPKITVKYFNNADKTIASINVDLIEFSCRDTVIKL